MKARHVVARLFLWTLLLYPLSYGPVICWAELHPKFFYPATDFYEPLFSIPGSANTLNWYHRLNAVWTHADTTLTYKINMGVLKYTGPPLPPSPNALPVERENF